MSQTFGNKWPRSRKRRKALSEYWYKNSIPKEDEVDPESLYAVLYRHPRSIEAPSVLIQWFYRNNRTQRITPWSEPAWFFPTDLVLLRHDVFEKGYAAFLRTPEFEHIPLHRHHTHDDIIREIRAYDR